MAQHPIRGGDTYDDYVGDAAKRRKGVKKWSARVRKVIAILNSLLHYDRLYLGGGNASEIVGKLPANVRICGNDAGITGGVRLWSRDADALFSSAPW